MEVQLVTLDDLKVLKLEILNGVKELLVSTIEPQNEFLKNKEVREMLGICPTTLQTLRTNGTLPYSKIGGALYYKRSDVVKVFNQNKRENRETIIS